MVDFLEACISPITLPFTALLVLVVLYWLTFILGAVDIEMFDALAPDVDGAEGGCLLSPVLQLLNIGDVPVMVVLSVLVVSGWWFSLMANHYLNPDQGLVLGVLLLLPNLVFSVVVTNLVTRPLRRVFAPERHEKVMFRVGEVITSRVTPEFGQIRIDTDGAPIVLNARTQGEVRLEKGDRALIYEEDRDKGIYFVEKYQE